MIGFIAHLYNSWLHFTNHYYTQTSVLSRCLVLASIVVHSSASVFHGSGPRWLAPISTTSQSSLKGYSSCPYGSWTALPNRQLKTVLLCPWLPSQGPGLPACRPTAAKLKNCQVKVMLWPRIRPYVALGWLHGKLCFQLFCCCVHKSSHGHVTLTEPLPSNGCVCRAIP
jgi:hypothetical protein